MKLFKYGFSIVFLLSMRAIFSMDKNQISFDKEALIKKVRYLICMNTSPFSKKFTMNDFENLEPQDKDISHSLKTLDNELDFCEDLEYGEKPGRSVCLQMALDMFSEQWKLPRIIHLEEELRCICVKEKKCCKEFN